MFHILYNVLLLLGLIAMAPYYGAKILFTGKYRKSIGPKLGLDKEATLDLPGSPRVWIHAVSVGEVAAAAPIIEVLRRKMPAACLVLSTSTETGQEMARMIVPQASAHIYYPLDLPCVVRKVVGIVKPDVFAAMETELWPNFIRICKRSGARFLVLNGRISTRSYKKYMLTGFFWSKILEEIDEVGVISEADAERVRDMGMPPHRVRICGNAKYDSLASRASDPMLQAEIAAKLQIAPGSRVFVAGSTHPGEETVVLDVYRELAQKDPDLLLILVPRHIDRGDEVVSAAKSAGIADVLKMSEMMAGRQRSGERVMVVDVIGELFKIYSLASIVFCGGSLVPRGGQNILEAGAWGKVVLYGKYMDDFLDEKQLLESAGAGITVNNGGEMYRAALELLDNPEGLREKGEAGRAAILESRGAAEKYAQMVVKNLPES